MTTKLHALVDENGVPLRLHLTPGQAHDAPASKYLLDKLQPGHAGLIWLNCQEYKLGLYDRKPRLTVWGIGHGRVFSAKAVAIE